MPRWCWWRVVCGTGQEPASVDHDDLWNLCSAISLLLPPADLLVQRRPLVLNRPSRLALGSRRHRNIRSRRPVYHVCPLGPGGVCDSIDRSVFFIFPIMCSPGRLAVVWAMIPARAEVNSARMNPSFVDAGYVAEQFLASGQPWIVEKKPKALAFPAAATCEQYASAHKCERLPDRACIGVCRGLIAVILCVCCWARHRLGFAHPRHGRKAPRAPVRCETRHGWCCLHEACRLLAVCRHVESRPRRRITIDFNSPATVHRDHRRLLRAAAPVGTCWPVA